jgi:hypothetical protein
MIEAAAAEHAIIHRDEFAYSAHPHCIVAPNGDWLVVFNRAPRRDITMHPPEDPLYRNVIMRSRDGGKTWTSPEVVPGYAFSGTECAGLTALRNGNILLNQWQFEWYPLGLARTLPDQARLTYPSDFLSSWLKSPEHDLGHLRNLAPEKLAPWVRGGGKAFTTLSADGGKSFGSPTTIITAPYSGGYGMRGAAELQNGELILPLSDVPHYRAVFVVRSNDGGQSWSAPRLAAEGTNQEFEEPAILICPSGKLVMVLRENVSRRLHQTQSEDGGLSWSPPRRLNIEGYPAHLLLLRDGRLLLTYGWRQPDYGIRAVLSEDEGASWNSAETISIRGKLPNRNLGYPSTIADGEDRLFTCYYGEDDTGCTCIMGTSWSLP